jgi:hypothetical protein
VALAVFLFGLLAFFVLRQILSENKNRVSRQVAVESLDRTFLNKVKAKVGKSLADLAEDEKIKVLKDMLGDENSLNRIVAIRYLSKLEDRKVAVEEIGRALVQDDTDVLEEAIFALKRLGDPQALGALKGLLDRVVVGTDATPPFSEVRTLSVIGMRDKDDLVFNIAELQQDNVTLSDSLVFETNLLVPKGYRYYFYFPNFDDSWEKFTGSKFVRNLVQQEAYQDIETLPWLQDFFQYKKLIDEQLGSFSKFFTPDRLFRDDFKIVKYDDGFLFLTFKGRNLELATGFIDVARKLGSSKFEVIQKQVKGTTITCVTPANSSRSFCYAAIADYFIFSNDSDLVERSIATFLERNHESITYDPVFQTAYAGIDHSGEKCFFFGYFEPSRLFDWGAESSGSAYIEKIALGAMSSIVGREISRKNFSDFGRGGDQKSDQNLSASNDALLKFIPEDVIAFGRSRDVDTKRYWNYVLKIGSAQPEAQSAFERAAQTRIEKDILDSFGNSSFAFFDGIRYSTSEGSRNLSALKFVFGTSLENRSRIAENLHRFFNYLFRSPVKIEEYNGIKIYSSSSEVQPRQSSPNAEENPIAPSFAILDSFLVLSTSRNSLARAVDTYRGTKPSIEGIVKLDQSSSTDMVFFTKPFLSDLLRFLRLYSTRSGTFSDFDVDERVKPLFEVLGTNESLVSSFSVSGFRLKGFLRIQTR